MAELKWEVSPSYCFTDSGGTTPAAVGDLVYVWKNTTAAHSFVQATSGNRPTLRQDAGGRYYLEFDGTADLMDYTGTYLNSPSNISWGFACKLRLTAGNTTHVIMRASHTASTIAWGSYVASSQLFTHARDSGATIKYANYDVNVANEVLISAASWSLSADTVNSSLSGLVDYPQVTGATMTPTTLTHLRLGSNSGTAASWAPMDLYGVVIDTAAWDATARATQIAYLQTLSPTTPLPAPALSGASASTDLWTSGTGYNTFRIPAVCRYDDGTADGLLMAVCEGRATAADDGDVDIVYRTSTNGGTSWAASAVATTNSTNVAGNPTIIPDPDRGVIHMIFVRQTAGDGTGHGATTRRPWYIAYTVSGGTWGTPVDISAQAMDTANWSWFASGPGAGVLIPSGANAGRIVVGCNHSRASYGSPYYKSHAIYSDDGGVNWTRTSPIDPLGTNETCITYVEDGTLLMSCRPMADNDGRYFATSSDDGATWTTAVADTYLPGDPCQAGLLRVQGRTLLSYVPDSVRSCLTLLSSTSADTANGWDRRSRFIAGPAAAYSSLVLRGDGSVGCLYERGSAVGTYTAVAWITFNPAGDITTVRRRQLRRHRQNTLLRM